MFGDRILTYEGRIMVFDKENSYEAEIIFNLTNTVYF